MVVVILRAQLQPGADEGVEKMLSPALDLAAATKGFIAFNRYAAGEEQLLLLEFESHEALASWRDHPDNSATQGAERDHLFKHLHIQVCDLVRAYEIAS